MVRNQLSYCQGDRFRLGLLHTLDLFFWFKLSDRFSGDLDDKLRACLSPDFCYGCTIQFWVEAVLQRLGGVRVAEVGTLAVCSRYKGKGVPLMLYNAMFRWAIDHRKVSTLVIAVHPRAASFYRNVLFFSPIGPVQAYTKLNNALSLPLAVNLARARDVFAKAYSAPGLKFTVDQTCTDLFDFFCSRHYPHIQLPAAQARWSADDVLTHMARCGTSPHHLSPRVRRALQLD